MLLHLIVKPRLIMPLLCTLVALGLFSLSSILSTPINSVHAGTIYKTVDKDGNIIFTDQPLEGAETHSGGKKPDVAAAHPEEKKSEVGDDSSVDAYEEPDETLSLAPEPLNPPKSDYKETSEPTENLPVTVVEILTPIHDATLHDPIGKIWVELQSYPTPLKKTGLTAQLWMDDELIASGKRPMLSLPAPDRGTHALVVKLVDEKGRLFLQSDPTHIHVKYRVNGQ